MRRQVSDGSGGRERGRERGENEQDEDLRSDRDGKDVAES